MKIYKDLIQGSDEWLELRRNKMTASHSTAIGTAGKGLETYIYELVAGMFGKREENYTNNDMERGNLLEPEARLLYSIETGNEVEQVGFIELDENVGCSPDGLVGKDGGIEIKCPNNTRYFKLLVNGPKEIDSAYIWQIQMNLLITGRKWWDFVAYNPNFEKNILFHRIKPDLEKFKKLEIGFEKGRALMEELINKLNK